MQVSQQSREAPDSPRLIGLDWGTSSLRAYLFDGNGTVIATSAHARGVLASAGADFAATYHAVVAEWRAGHPHVPAIAAGMIGSTEGWVRAPYSPCPAGVRELAAALVPIVTSDDGIVYVIPGVELRGSAPNVMRGEETQIAGALSLEGDLEPDATLVLPGTHAKWVDVNDGRIVRFATYMTGELYAVLSEHSILGRPAKKAAAGAPAEAPFAGEAFDRGVETARDHGSSGIAPLLFLTRSLVLAGALRADESLDFLSGLLIGDELRCGLNEARSTVVLVGDPALCKRYRRALRAFGLGDTPVIDGSAPAGLWRIACLAELVAAPLSRV